MSSQNIPVQRESTVPGKACYQVWRTNFEIDEKYSPIKAIGKGAYGVVCSAKDGETGAKVAIKKITNAFENLVDARRTLREMKLLRYLRCVPVQQRQRGRGGGAALAAGGAPAGQRCCCCCCVLPHSQPSVSPQHPPSPSPMALPGRHDNIIAVCDIMRPASKESFNDVYIVYELMDTDLHQIIRSSQPLTDDHFQYFIYQILRGL